jgi:galactosamine-6-phosphate isomerase
MNPLIRVFDDHESMSRQVAERVLNALANKPDLLLCAAGGSTPLRTYELLAEHRARQPDLFHSMRVVKLDEWGGIAMDDPGSCDRQIRTHLISPLGVSEDRHFGFMSDPPEPQAECDRIRSRLASEGPIDLCLLGLGMNGHVAMNEPAVSLQPVSHVAQLTETTLSHPMLADTKSKPRFGLTLGMAEILSSSEIILLVSGAQKREPLRTLLRRQITTAFPATFLWPHPNWTLLCDRAASEGLHLQM